MAGFMNLETEEPMANGFLFSVENLNSEDEKEIAISWEILEDAISDMRRKFESIGAPINEIRPDGNNMFVAKFEKPTYESLIFSFDCYALKNKTGICIVGSI